MMQNSFISSFKKGVFLFVFLLLIFLFVAPQKTEAALDCSLTTDPPAPIPNTAGKITLNFQSDGIADLIRKQGSMPGRLEWSFPGTACGRLLSTTINSVSDLSNIPDTISITFEDKRDFWDHCKGLVGEGDHTAELIYNWNQQIIDDPNNIINVCEPKTYTVQQNQGSCKPSAEFDGTGDVDDTSWRITVDDIKLPTNYFNIQIDIDGNTTGELLGRDRAVGGSPVSVSIPANVRNSKITDHRAAVYATQVGGINRVLICDASFNIARRGDTPVPTASPYPTPTTPALCFADPCNKGLCTTQCYSCPGCPGFQKPGPLIAPKYTSICNQLSNQENFRAKCQSCQEDGKHIWSAIGCLPIEMSVLIKEYIFKTGVGIAGSIAFLYFIYGIFMILTSAGNPEQMEEAKQVIISSLSGLLLIIFSVFLLKIIGVDVLGLPEFK